MNNDINGSGASDLLKPFPPPQTELVPAFLVDVMLGTLAKWLRILGLDAAYDNRIDDQRLVERCLQESRIAVTRDRRLVQRAALRDRHILIRGDALSGQLQQVLEQVELSPYHSPFSRCVVCNIPLIPLSRFLAEALVPPYVFQTQQTFKQCPRCRRVLWKGTHRSRIQKKLQEMGVHNL